MTVLGNLGQLMAGELDWTKQPLGNEVKDKSAQDESRSRDPI